MNAPDHHYAIRVNNLSKTYRIYRKPSDMLWEVMSGSPRYREFRALEDISFDVRSGAVVGIIGRNGSGKSTLLKIIAGTLDKTGGSVAVQGKVSAILELGTGFNPEYTGRQNIYIGGLCLGMPKDEIEQKIDSIIEFSELRSVIDQLFRTYSTGMQARLTFATAISVNPDILIIDEALSVGDNKFQRKCFAKFQELRDAGKTILFVSHDINAVNHLCDETLLLEGGRVLQQGEPREVTKFYHKMLFGSEAESKKPAVPSVKTEPAGQTGPGDQGIRAQVELKNTVLQKLNLPAGTAPADTVTYGTKKAEIIDYGIMDKQAQRTHLVQSGQPYTIFLRVLFYEDLHDLTLGCRIQNTRGIDIFAANTFYHKVAVPPQKRGDVLECCFHVNMHLAPGDFFLTFGVRKIDLYYFYDRRVDTLHFKVVGDSSIDPVCLVNLEETVAVKKHEY